MDDKDEDVFRHEILNDKLVSQWSLDRGTLMLDKKATENSLPGTNDLQKMTAASLT